MKSSICSSRPAWYQFKTQLKKFLSPPLLCYKYPLSLISAGTPQSHNLSQKTEARGKFPPQIPTGWMKRIFLVPKTQRLMVLLNCGMRITCRNHEHPGKSSFASRALPATYTQKSRGINQQEVSASSFSEGAGWETSRRERQSKGIVGLSVPG